MKRFSIPALALSLCHIVAQAEDVLLLLAPEAGAPILARVDADDPAIKNASEVISGGADGNAWRWTDYPITLNGYVPTASVGKNFAIDGGTPLRIGQTNDADILSILEADDTFTVIQSAEKWTRVSGTKTIPVYFSRSLLRTDPTGPSETGTASFAAITLQPASPITETDIVVPAEAFASPQTLRALPRSPEQKNGTPTRTMAGKLVRRLKNSGPRYPLRLLSPSGDRIAYVDLSRAFVSDVRPYLDRRVYVTGETRSLVPGSSELIIFARKIRLSD